MNNCTEHMKVIFRLKMVIQVGVIGMALFMALLLFLILRIIDNLLLKVRRIVVVGMPEADTDTDESDGEVHDHED